MTTSSAAEVIGDRYVLGPVVGRGAMGEIRQAEDLCLARSVAIKLLHPSLAEQPESRLRFEQEVRAAARVSDRNVVAIYDTGEHLGRPYIVMELLSGRTLRDEVLEGPLTEERARQVTTALLFGLQAAHDAGVVHRDIKPANVLLNTAGEAKLADFGIAKGAESNGLTAPGLVLGTPSYLAPECVTGGEATVASDLYAVGVVLYEALGGRRPFVGDSPLATCHAICTEEPPSLRDLRPDLSAQLAGVVTRAIARDPEQRYRSAAEMIRDLEPATGPALALVDEPTVEIDAAVPGWITTNENALLPRVREDRRSRVGSARRHARSLAALVAIAIGASVFFSLWAHRADTSTNSPAVQNAATVPTRLPTTTRPTVTPLTATPITAAPLVTSPAASVPTTTPPTSTPPTTTAPTTTPPTTTPPTTTPPTTTPPTTAPPATTPPTTTA